MTITLILMIVIAALIGRFFLKTILTFASIVLITYFVGGISIQEDMNSFSESVVDSDNYKNIMHRADESVTKILNKTSLAKNKDQKKN